MKKLLIGLGAAAAGVAIPVTLAAGGCGKGTHIPTQNAETKDAVVEAKIVRQANELNRVILNVDPAIGDGKKIDGAMLIHAIEKLRNTPMPGLVENKTLMNVQAFDLKIVNGPQVEVVDEQSLHEVAINAPTILNIEDVTWDSEDDIFLLKTLALVKKFVESGLSNDAIKQYFVAPSTIGTAATMDVKLEPQSNGHNRIVVNVTPATNGGQLIDEAMLIQSFLSLISSMPIPRNFTGHKTLLNIEAVDVKVIGSKDAINIIDEATLDGLPITRTISSNETSFTNITTKFMENIKSHQNLKNCFVF